jgi:flagellar basal body rod protein FlgB
MDALSIARGGLAAAERRFETAASRIVQAPADETIDLGHEMVEMIQAKHHFSANLKVIRFADEMWKSLLEIQVR